MILRASSEIAQQICASSLHVLHSILTHPRMVRAAHALLIVVAFDPLPWCVMLWKIIHPGQWCGTNHTERIHWRAIRYPPGDWRARRPGAKAATCQIPVQPGDWACWFAQRSGFQFYLVGGWALPLWKKMKFSWGDYSQYMASHKIHVPNHQPVMVSCRTCSSTTWP